MDKMHCEGNKYAPEEVVASLFSFITINRNSDEISLDISNTSARYKVQLDRLHGLVTITCTCKN